jgi:aspartate/methionine/tyrosine aminotransferase
VTTAVNRLSRRVCELAPSQTLALSARAKELKAAGHPVINFSAGEPDFSSPQVVADAAKAAIDAGDTHYPPVPGTQALREAICDHVAERTGHRATPSRVVVGVGAKHVLFNLFQALIDPGDEVVLAAPYWVSYPAQVALAGGRAVPIPTDPAEGFRLDPEAAVAAMGPRCKAIVLNSPGNPSGAVLPPEDMEAIVKAALDKGVVVISDEIYSGLLYDGVDYRSAFSVDDPRIADGVVLVDGVSKSYAMTGWRIGYAVGPEDLIKAAGKIQSQSTSGACSIAQAASVAALRDGAPEAAKMCEAFAKRRALAVELLEAIPGVTVPPAKGAFYVFPDVSGVFGKTIQGVKIEGSLSLSELLLEKAHVAAVPGAAFGADAHLRFSYALGEDDIRTGLTRVAELLSKAE